MNDNYMIKSFVFRYSFLCFLLVFCISNLTSQCANNLLNNGSFTSEEGELVTAPGWTTISLTPDVNDASGPLNSTPGYNWTGIPLPSSNGGTWQNLYSNEKISQTINLISGRTYTLTFEYAAQGIFFMSYLFTNPVGVKVFLDGVLVYTTPNDISQYTWETATYSFTAQNNSVTIEMSASEEQYVAIDGACLISKTQQNDPPIILEMPNVFTPNSDGNNDTFHPLINIGISISVLTIYNRWGQKLFETNDINKGWDGKYHENECPDGTYFWILNYKTPKNDSNTEKGFLTLFK